jgi:hypothetical protein
VLDEPALAGIEPVAAGVQDAGPVGHDDLADPFAQQELGDRHPRAPGAGHRHREVLEALVHDPQRVVQRGEHHDRGAVLVVVEHGDVQRLAQPLLDLEALRCGDVLEVDPAVDRGDRLDDPHDLVDVLGVEAHRPCVDPREVLEQGGLALHHRQRRHPGRCPRARAPRCRR